MGRVLNNGRLWESEWKVFVTGRESAVRGNYGFLVTQEWRQVLLMAEDVPRLEKNR